MKAKKSVVKIYKSRMHLAFTILTLVMPFLFLLIFTKLANLSTGKLFVDISISLVRLTVAYVVSVTLAWVFAALLYRTKSSKLWLPLFDVLQSFPTFAALPIAIFVWGPSDWTVIFFLILTMIWPILFSIYSSLELIRNEWEEAVDVMGLTGWNYVRRFLWPASITSLITGSIIGLGEGWEALVATEIIVGSSIGLGNFFKNFQNNIPVTSLGILGLLILIFVINKLIWLPLLYKSHQEMEE